MGAVGVVHASENQTWLDLLATDLLKTPGNQALLGFMGLITLAALVSGFVNNVPFLLAMIPFVQKLSVMQEAPLPLYMFSLLIGASLRGNITPIGTSANIVAVGLLRKRGITARFREFMKLGIPFTIAAVSSASIFVWLVWG